MAFAKLLPLALLIFLAFSLFSYYEICCMFAAIRHYGWPYPYLSLHKSVETLGEANRIKTDSLPSLVKDGWELSYAGDMYKAFGSPTIGLSADILVAFAAAFAVYYLVLKYGRRLWCISTGWMKI